MKTLKMITEDRIDEVHDICVHIYSLTSSRNLFDSDDMQKSFLHIWQVVTTIIF
jgi:hypothetical protein